MCTPACLDWWTALASLSRREFLTGAASVALAVACATPSRAAQPAGRAVLDETFSVDLHAHPALIPGLASATIEGHGRAMARGQVGAVFMAAVADGPIIGRRPNGGLYATREPRPGELYASTWRQLDVLARSAKQIGLRPLLKASDVAAAVGAQQRGSLLSVEGGDFLEERLDRVQESYDRGVRSIQLVHYRINELGDIQTEPPARGGLTPFGRDVLREMNRLGMVVDLAHATFDVVKGAVDTSTKPMIVSHTNLQDFTGFSRFVSREHARLVAGQGGLIGAWPISITPAGFDRFVEHIARLVDAVGVDHVGIGTDMDGVGRNALFTDYADWPSIPVALLARGFARPDVAKVMGGNFRRVFDVVAGGS